jgi:hypothetical protein
MAKRSDSDESKPKKGKRLRRVRRLLGLSVIGGGAAIAFSESVRSKVLDKLFGAEEEFQYSPPADAVSTATDAPAEEAE